MEVSELFYETVYKQIIRKKREITFLLSKKQLIPISLNSVNVSGLLVEIRISSGRISAANIYEKDIQNCS